ncbi:MAG TPA: pantoate--beta-alanine ligase [Roseiflexaceae bacterium]|nr:pantoate--beta-alanine ligase [Roseiflexaceae bacterium]
MQVLTTIAAFRAARAGVAGDLGLVPTMGFLHEGHLALVRQARADNRIVAATIFVNPTQFGRNEDFARYPRDLPRDLQLLEAAGPDLVFVPDADEMYPAGFATAIDVGPIAEPLEGAVRPGHFRGVATVVCKLFGITTPQRAYFGQKDAQQTLVIRRMIQDLNLPVKLVVCPTLREADGLAMSSRNVYLSAADRRAAPVIYRALQQAAAMYADGERSVAVLRAAMHTILAAEPLADLQYLSIADIETLHELELIDDRALVSLAVRFGTTRLIDNMLLESSSLAHGAKTTS